jgi:hypothetical protein
VVAKNDQEDAYEKYLSASLARVIDFVKFGDAKNAALLAFDSAATVAIGNMLTRQEGAPAAFSGVLPVAGTLLIVSALVALFAIMPRADLARFYKRADRDQRAPNLLFFGDIAKIPMTDFSTRARDRYLPDKGRSATDDYLTDLSIQVRANSAVAARKYSLFKLGGWLTFAALVIVSSPAIIYLLKAVARSIGCGG